MSGSVSRRDFARLFALGGSAALFADPAWAKQNAPAFVPGIPGSGEALEIARAVRDAGRPRRAERGESQKPRGRCSAPARNRQRRPRPVGQNRARLSGEKENLRRRWRRSRGSRPLKSSPATPARPTTQLSGLDLKPGSDRFTTTTPAT